MDQKELMLLIGELYVQLRKMGDIIKELERKNQDKQEEISLLKHGKPNQGSSTT